MQIVKLLGRHAQIRDEDKLSRILIRNASAQSAWKIRNKESGM